MTQKKKINLSTGAKSTWCPGCYNFLLLKAVQKALGKVIKSDPKVNQESIVMATGIGCHGKMFDYLNVGGVYSLHGRVLPACLGMKLGNPNLTVIGFGGDGDTYAEGTAHLVHTARYNLDMTMVVHNNQTFALTTGQGTPTSETGFKSKSQPQGVVSRPLNPLKIALDSGATFIARAYPKFMDQTAEIIKEAIEHKGFSLVDVALPCLVYHKDMDFLDKHIYKLEGHDPEDKEEARKKIEEWDYSLKDRKIPAGIIYRKKEKILTDKFPQLKRLKQKGKGWWEVER